MGGCRCLFRGCKVNTTKNPLMHFFRFPIKDSARLQLWVKYSKVQHILNYPINKQKNCVICSRHFRDECFMNYKKDRLVPTAVPTIHRLTIDKALDYELDVENGALVTLAEPTQKHLIPPYDFECPLGLDVDESLWVMLKDSEKRIIGENVNNEVGASDSIFLIDEIDEVAENNRTSGGYFPVTRDKEQPQYSQKRTRNTENINSLYSSNKKIKTLNSTQQLTTVIDPENITLHERMITVQDNEANNPTIINHQIIEVDGDMWVSQESYNIANNGADYELVEIQTNDVIDAAAETEKSLPPPEKINEEASAKEELCTSEQCQANSLEMENTNTELNEENKKLERNLQHFREENKRKDKCLENLRSEIDTLTKENAALKTQIQYSQTSTEKENALRESYEQRLQSEQSRHTEIEKTLQQQISALSQSLELVRQQLKDTKNNLISAKKDYATVQREKINLIKQQVEADHKLHNAQDMYDNLYNKLSTLQKNYEIQEKNHAKLKEDFTKLETQHNQVSTITTSNSSSKDDTPQASLAQTPTATMAGSLTKAQLFNGIKRYVSASMMALLRMEMFGSSDREWKPDERQVAVDLLRLGETVYKYFTDEWRLRLPGLRDARNWLSQAVDINDEEDL